MTEELRRKLNLKPIRRGTVQLNTFGGERYSKNICSFVNFKVKGLNSENLCLTAMSYPALYTNLPARFDMTPYPHLKNVNDK